MSANQPLEAEGHPFVQKEPSTVHSHTIKSRQGVGELELSMRDSYKDPSLLGDPSSQKTWVKVGDNPSASLVPKLNLSKEEIKEELQRRKERNEANIRLTNFKKSFQRKLDDRVPTLQEKIQGLPTFFKKDDW